MAMASTTSSLARLRQILGGAATLASEPDLAKVLEIVRKATGVDFTHYKAGTLHRRVSRRMILHKVEGMRDYLRFLRKNPAEVEALYQDILIPVTRFFRDPGTLEAFQAHDQYVVLGGVLLAAVVLVAGNLVADLLLATADPRIRHDA